MQIMTSTSDFRLPASVVSIGMFDGVHRGHRRVLGLLRDVARGRGLPTVLVTFDPHPRAVLRPESAPPLLSTLEDRMHLLAKTECVDYCLVLPFDRQRSAEPVEEFVHGTLVERLGIRSLVVGENFACGRGRKGDIARLRALGSEAGFSVLPVPLRADTEPGDAAHCSSTETRRLIQLGEIYSAALLLERPHEMTGTVAATSVSVRHVVDVVVPGNLCSPPAGDYAGMVRKKEVSGPWTCATLRVREESGGQAHSMRLYLEQETAIAPGDTIALRFFDRAPAFSATPPANSRLMLAHA
jgi:riboflavin kinase/FMN adenylyltransferase